METVQAQLLTVVLPFLTGDRLTRDLKALGVSGYTTTRVNGFGVTGTKTYGLIEGANLQLETIVSRDLCDRIMQYLITHYTERDWVAYRQDVDAIPAAHFSRAR